MAQQIQALIIEPNNKVKCDRAHSPFFNHKIKGTKKRYCTFIMVDKCYVSKEGRTIAVFCGDVP